MQQPGTLIEGKYEILGKIREGGMGAIYKVRHRLLDEIRVVKVMQQNVVADEEMKRRFLEEARTATRLKHPNLCTIHDFALDEEGKAYLVMEFIDGMTVADLLRRKGPPGLALSLEIAHQALLALAYLHRKSVVHRDIAPDNLMLTYDEDDRPVVKLIDLGIAKTLDKGVGMTSTGVFLGKLKYASPEQYGALPAGEKLDGRSDIYSLGVVLYELLTGKRPFVGESPTELLRAHLFEPPIPFATSDPDGKAPPEVREAVLKALAKKREDRFTTAEQFDREIVSLEQRFARPDDIKDSAKILTTIIPGHPTSDVTVTPSAQNRLDMQFVAAATPLPTKPKLTVVGPPPPEDLAGTEIAMPKTVAAIGEKIPPRKSRRLLLIAAAVVVVGAAIGLLTLRRQPAPAVSSAPASVPRPAPTARAAPQPTAAAAAQPTALPAPSEPVVAEPAAASSPLPAAPRQEEARQLRRLAETSRSDTANARRRAERAGAPRQAAALYETGQAREKEGQRKLSEKDYLSARTAFDAAKAVFQSATIAAASAKPPRPAEQVAALPAPTARPEAPRPVAVPAAAPAPVEAPREAAKPPPLAPTEPRREASDADRIRETIRHYVEAQNALDVDRYAKVFPSVNRARVQTAFDNYRSQSLELDIQKIDIAPGGTRATVRGHERRLWVPKIGSEQRDSRTTTIQLEKRGENWVITGLS